MKLVGFLYFTGFCDKSLKKVSVMVGRISVEFKFKSASPPLGAFVPIRLFHIHTKLAIIALMPTLYSHIVAVFFVICI